MPNSLTEELLPTAALWKALAPAKAWNGEWFRFTHDDLGRVLNSFVEQAPFDVEFDRCGSSSEGRPLWTLRFGNPSGRRVMIWARQHGDEPDCSAGLCAFLFDLAARHEAAPYDTILSKLDICVLPMVNPDGVARFTRQNAQCIDLNRDAAALATPEGRALKALKDRFDPEYGFNLHDMGPRKSTTEGHLVALAYQAGPYNHENEDNEVRLKAKTVVGHMAAAARKYCGGGLARYTANYMPTAFGDGMMRWGVCSILIEAGGWFDAPDGAPEDQGGDEFVRRAFALSLVAGLASVAHGLDKPATGAQYEKLPYDSGAEFVDFLGTGADIMDGGARRLVRGDVAWIDSTRRKRMTDTIPPPHDSAIVNLGDIAGETLRKRTIDLSGYLAMPGLIGFATSRVYAPEAFSPDAAVPYLKAGFTTIAAGFGPFANAREREAFAQKARAQSPPIHVVALEAVEAPQVIRERHGMTELAGFMIREVGMTARQLGEFAHLFHPAIPNLQLEDPEQSLRADVAFLGAGSARETRLVVSYRSTKQPVREAPCDHESLCALAKEFLEHPKQIYFCRCPKDDAPDLLSLAAVPSLLPETPSPGWLAKTILARNAASEMSVSVLVNSLTIRMAHAFRLQRTGVVRVGARADLAVFPRVILDPQEEEPSHLAPHYTVLNGRVVWEKEGQIMRPGTGIWRFAAPAGVGL
ncbi:MAG: M14 family zinc carboxypeptidase [Sumerlaeia bacterium]